MGSRVEAAGVSLSRRPRSVAGAAVQALGRRPGVGGRSVGPLGAHAEPEPPSRLLALGDPGQALAPDRERLRQVAGEQPGVPDPVAHGLAGQSVEVDAQARGVVRREALREQRADRPGQDVARAAASPWPGSRTAPPPPSRPGRR